MRGDKRKRELKELLTVLELGHEDFAETIGCSRPMVSRLIAELTEQGSD